MTYLAVAEAVLIGVFVVLLVMAMRSSDRAVRAHTRERDLLINQLLHARGQTWQPPPAPEPEPEREQELEQEPMLMLSPDQLPDF